MSKLHLLLYSLIFSYSSLFAYQSTGFYSIGTSSSEEECKNNFEGVTTDKPTLHLTTVAGACNLPSGVTWVTSITWTCDSDWLSRDNPGSLINCSFPKVVCTVPQVVNPTTNQCTTPTVLCIAPQFTDPLNPSQCLSCTAPEVYDPSSATSCSVPPTCTAPLFNDPNNPMNCIGCTAPAVYDSVTKSCLTPQTPCTPPEVRNIVTGICGPPTTPTTCTLPKKLDSLGNCTVPPECDPYSAGYATADCDGDGVPNSLDADPFDPANSGSTTSECRGSNEASVQLHGATYSFPKDYIRNGTSFGDQCKNKIGTYSIDGVAVTVDFNPACETEYCYIHQPTNCDGPDKSSPALIHSFNDYTYEGEMGSNECFSNYPVGIDNIDHTVSIPDKSLNCIKSYCYVHYASASCQFSAQKYKPQGNWVYTATTSENECTSLVDGNNFIDSEYILPSPVHCKQTAFCFIEYASSLLGEPDTNSEDDLDDDGNPMEEPDLNSTSADNKALLQAQNNTNEHLQDVKDKLDLSREKLDSMDKSLDGINTSNTQIKQALDKLNIDSSTSMRSQLSELKTTNSNLSNMNSNLNSANSKLSTLNSQMANNGGKLESIKDTLNDGLFGDDPFDGVDLTDDGSSTFSTLGTEASDSFHITHEQNMFGLYGTSGGTLPTYSVSLLGKTITFFEPSMLNGLPLADIKSLILFMCALVGFAQTFRST